MISPKAFGARLKSARQRLGMTQAALGESCGVNRSHICTMEYGEKWPSLAVLSLLCNVTGMTPDALLGFGIGVSEDHRRLTAEYRRGFAAGAAAMKSKIERAIEVSQVRPPGYV